MKIYFAPMEGITGYVFRNSFNYYYGDSVDRYYSPFIMAHEKCGLSNKEINDIHPDNNMNLTLIPQVMTNNYIEYSLIEPQIMDFGYTEINLNFGCPSKTVTTRKRGSGILSDLDLLDNFLYDLFANKNADISIKTRIGVDFNEEFEEILSIYNKYEIKELIIHPRVQKQLYSGVPAFDYYEYARKNSKNPIVYNGNIFNKEDVTKYNLNDEEALMIGRGLIKNPNLAFEILGLDIKGKEVFKDFMNSLLLDYSKAFSGDVPVLHKMKEIWGFITLNEDGCKDIYVDKNLMKKLMKAKNIQELKMIQNGIIDSIEI